ncbi:MAG: Spy/CpxP family protein refolding chaperone [Nitrospira sp.]|nr:Spy/CpxP family protein refolding chaperone [Nitrospira sp.]
MKTTFFRVAVGVVLIAGAVAASACHRHHTPAERAEWMTEKIAKHLDLDDRQKTALIAVKNEALAARAGLQKEQQALVEELIVQIQSDRLDQAKVTGLIERHQALQVQMMMRVFPKFAEWQAGLRPEQKAEAAEHIRMWMARYEESH